MLEFILFFPLLVFIIPEFTIILLVAIILLFIFFPKQRKKLFCIFLIVLFIPFGFYGFGILEGFNSYQNGTAMLAEGYPNSNRNRLNPKYRLRSYNGYGCSPDITSYKEDGKKDSIKFMIDNFGYIKNTYTGYYPTIQEILSNLEKAKKTTIKYEYEKGIFELNINNEIKKVYEYKNKYLDDLEIKNKIKVDPIEIFNYRDLRGLNYDDKNNFEVKAFLINDCLVIQDIESKNVYLIDSKKGLVFTEYREYDLIRK